MDDYMFRTYVRECKCVRENTSYLEIFNYSDPTFNSCEEHRFGQDELADEFSNWLHRRGAFEPPKLPPGVKLLGGIRLILQLDAKDPNTFSPAYISLTHDAYEEMVRVLHLPFRAIEGNSVVGPFFWSSFDQDDEDPHLQIIFRKSDVRKRGYTRGWELMLSHSFRTGITSGYAKGTASSDMIESIRHLRACAAQVQHPLLLPAIVLSHELSIKMDQKQRETREWLRQLEYAVSMRTEVLEHESKYIRADADNTIDLDQLNRDLVECHSQVLWKRPQAYQEIVRAMGQAMERFWSRAANDPSYGGPGGEVDKLHRSLLSRLEFYQAKLKGIENYAHITLERLTIQRGALYNIIAQKESKLGLQMAAEQRRLAHAAKRDSTSMKMLSLMGAIFLPATFIAGIFSMAFFDFIPDTPDEGGGGGGGGGEDPNGGGGGGGAAHWQPVSPLIWIYFVITAPLTVAIVLLWRWWDRRREAKYAKEDADIEAGIDKMEAQIMATMRKRTLSKMRTWDVGGA